MSLTILRPFCFVTFLLSLVTLEPNQQIQREISGGQIHTYPVDLETGRFLHVIVEPEGIDLVIKLLGPKGVELSQMDHPNETNGQERISWVAEESGQYQIAVQSPDERAPSGKYRIWMDPPRTAQHEDTILIQGERAFAQAERLRVQESAESLTKSLELYQQALVAWRTAEDSRGQAETLNNIGYVYALRGEPQLALDHFLQALSVMRQMGDRALESTALNNIGMIHDSLGEKEKALEYHLPALEIRRAVGDRQGEAISLNNIAQAYSWLGEPQKAFDCYRQALSLWRAIGDRHDEARAINNLARLYESLGEYEKALEHYRQARTMFQSVGDLRGEASTLRNLGRVFDLRNDKQQSFSCYQKALELVQKAGDRRMQAYMLLSIGTIHAALGESEKAWDLFSQALSLQQAVGDRRGEASVLLQMARQYSSLGQPEKALQNLSQALVLQRLMNNPWGEAATLYAMASATRSQGNAAEALEQINAALEIIESLRTKVADLDLRASYLASESEYYEFQIDLLMQMHHSEPLKGYDAQAFHISERARARSLLELLAESRTDIRQNVDPDLLQRENTLRQILLAKTDQQMRLSGSKNTEKQAIAVAGEVEGLKTEYEQVEAQIRAASPRYAALTQPQPLHLQEIQQQVLDSKTLLLEYFLGEQRSFVWVVTQAAVKSYELPARSIIENAGRRLYDLLTAGKKTQETTYWSAAQTFSQMLLQPFASELGQKRLLIVSDGALHFVPFAALPAPGSPNTPLAVDHEIVGLPSASALAVLRHELAAAPPAARAIAVFADPVFDREDERIQTASGDALKNPKEGGLLERAVSDLALSGDRLGLARLPFTRREARAILSLVSPQDRMEALDFDANRDTATGSRLRDYRIVHFATHGFFNSSHPELSGIVLSLVDQKGKEQEGFLSAVDVFNLKLNAEMVVLSACRSALGKEVKGEGLVGMMRGLMYAGAARVVASLWKVDDAATAELMKRFYEKMLGPERLSPAPALRAAQLEIRSQKRWRSPYYWAAFVIQGEYP